MRKQEVRKLCDEARTYYKKRILELLSNHQYDDASALYEEMREWWSNPTKSKILTVRRNKKAKSSEEELKNS
jgi:hypothetical protein